MADPLGMVHDTTSPLYSHLVNHNHGASLSYGENKNAWAMLQFYRRLNPRGRNITLRVEGSMGDSDNRNVSNNEVALHRVDSSYYTARYNTTPSDNKSYVLSALYSEPQ